MAIKNRSVIVRSFTEVWEDGQFVHTSSSAETIKPGTLVYQADGGLTLGDKPAVLPKYKVNADVNYPPCIVFEDDLQGKTIDDPIASGDYIRVKYLAPGEKYVVYSASGEEVTVGLLLNPHTDGTVTLHASTGAAPDANSMTLFRAETAVAAADADRRLVVRVLRV